MKKVYDMSHTVHSAYHVEQSAAVLGFTHFKSRWSFGEDGEVLPVRAELADASIDHNPLIDADTYLNHIERWSDEKC